jgi:YrbI family 3-deoxy-D-manno-octulosonate 8-phosphate phosphatase
LAVAFIPVRGGSKSIPLKNIQFLAGKPLLHWTLEAANGCTEITKIIVATDSPDIERVAKEFQSDKIEIYKRSPKNAQDKSSTESVMLEYLEQANLKSNEQFILVQATNPFTKSADLSKALKQIKREKAQSLLSVVNTKRFFWKNNKPLNYDFKKRPRRQSFPGMAMENGAFYIQSVAGILKSKNRLSGKIALYEMPEISGFEIDEPEDWTIVGELLSRQSSSKVSKVPRIKLFLTDCDGVLTDAGMYYSSQGDAMKKFNTLDGMGLQQLKAAGVEVGIVTGENTEIVAKRAEKLKIDLLKQGAKDKLSIVKELCKERNISLQEVAFIGDDINDFEILSAVGMPACPQNAVTKVKSVPGILKLSKKGGEGAVREFTETVLKHNESKKS